jgi:hypothetical protein
MGEAYAWPEGTIYLWTGTASAAAVAGLAINIRADFDYGVDNYRTLDGVYRNLHTGQRADVQIGGLYTPELSALQAMEAAKTAIHLHLKLYNSAHVGSAGFVLYTGAIDRFGLNGAEGGLFQTTISFHANVWTGYNK